MSQNEQKAASSSVLRLIAGSKFHLELFIFSPLALLVNVGMMYPARFHQAASFRARSLRLIAAASFLVILSLLYVVIGSKYYIALFPATD